MNLTPRSILNLCHYSSKTQSPKNNQRISCVENLSLKFSELVRFIIEKKVPQINATEEFLITFIP